MIEPANQKNHSASHRVSLADGLLLALNCRLCLKPRPIASSVLV